MLNHVGILRRFVSYDHLIDPAADQFAAGPWAPTFRSFDDYKERFPSEQRESQTVEGYQLVSFKLIPTRMPRRRLKPVDLCGPVLVAGLVANMVLPEIGKRLAMPDAGITFVQFHFTTNAQKLYLEQIERQGVSPNPGHCDV